MICCLKSNSAVHKDVSIHFCPFFVRSLFLVIPCQLKEFLRMLATVILEVCSGELLTLFASTGADLEVSCIN